jgi:hypothetical protein
VKLQCVKTLILSVGILINLISYTALADGPAGRFQIVPATVEALFPGTATPTKELKVVFKVDTVTGQTWYYVTGINKDGALVNKWSPIDNQN